LKLRRDEPALRSGEPGHSEAIPIDGDSLLLRRESEGGATLWVAVRFKGSGTIDLAAHAGTESDGWELALTTQDPPFAPEPDREATAPRVDLSKPAPTIEFRGPAAVILRERPAGMAILKG
jgi:hypothetical protein